MKFQLCRDYGGTPKKERDLDFDLREEHKMIRDMCRDFSRDVIAPRAEEIKRTGEYAYDIISQMAELGVMGITISEEYGGSGGDWVGMHLCIEEVSRGDATFGALLDVTTSVVAQELNVFDTEEQKKKWLVPIARDERIGAFGLTEPDAGSDAGSIRTTAKLDGREWVISGTKQFITNIGLDNASMIVITALTKKAVKGRGRISTFIVPKDSPGFSLGKRYEKIGWHGSATHEVIFEDCRIPEDNLLGDPVKGFLMRVGRPWPSILVRLWRIIRNTFSVEKLTLLNRCPPDNLTG